jgi:hypothetical protein
MNGSATHVELNFQGVVKEKHLKKRESDGEYFHARCSDGVYTRLCAILKRGFFTYRVYLK